MEAQIHAEWMAAVQKNRPDLTSARIDRTRAQMDAAIEDCLVTGFEGLIPSLELPDPDDRHVLAAAIHAGAAAIVTSNLKDFPPETLASHQVAALAPDRFVCDLMQRAPWAVLQAFREQRQSMKNPPRTAEELLDDLRHAGFPDSAALLAPHAAAL